MRCLIVHNYYQKRGGEDSVFEAESNLLSSGGHDVRSFTLHNDSLIGRSKIAIAADTVWNRDVYRQMKQSVREFKPDIVHFHNTFPLISPAAVYAAKDAGAAVILVEQHARLVLSIADTAAVIAYTGVFHEQAARLHAEPELLERAYLGTAE